MKIRLSQADRDAYAAMANAGKRAAADAPFVALARLEQLRAKTARDAEPTRKRSESLACEASNLREDAETVDAALRAGRAAVDALVEIRTALWSALPETWGDLVVDGQVEATIVLDADLVETVLAYPKGA